MNTKQVGNITEAKILSKLVECGKTVLMPFGENCRYDMAVDDDGVLVRVQCKSGHLKSGSILFNASSIHGHRSKPSKPYTDEADYFGVYCAALGTCYLVPVEDVTITCGSLRVEPPLNNQVKGIRWAVDYEF